MRDGPSLLVVYEKSGWLFLSVRSLSYCCPSTINTVVAYVVLVGGWVWRLQARVHTDNTPYQAHWEGKVSDSVVYLVDMISVVKVSGVIVFVFFFVPSVWC